MVGMVHIASHFLVYMSNNHITGEFHMATIKRKKKISDLKIPNFKAPGFGAVLFTIVFIYILVMIINSINSAAPVIFTVEQSSYDTDFTATGLAIRNETLLSANVAGMPYYYVRDGQKVSKNSNIYAMDSSGSFQNAMDSLQENGEDILTGDDYSGLKNQIKMFKTGFSASSFGDMYSFKTSIDNKLLELYEEKAFELAGKTGSTNLLNAEKAPFSGLVTYYQDGYENITVKDLIPDLFDKTVYSKKTLKTENGIEIGEPVCKLVDDESWEIAILLTKEEFDKVTKNSMISYTINDSSRKLTTDYEKLERDGSYYIIVSFNKYISQYVNERFLDINFSFEESSGLKIPQSAIVHKDAYMIPVSFLTSGGDDKEYIFFNQSITKANGQETSKLISPLIYFQDDRFCYVDMSEIDSDAILKKMDSDETFSVATAARYTMDGVLCVTKGTAQFRRIVEKVSGDDYSIVEPGISYGISRYDRILLDGTSMKEGDMLN